MSSAEDMEANSAIIIITDNYESLNDSLLEFCVLAEGFLSSYIMLRFDREYIYIYIYMQK